MLALADNFTRSFLLFIIVQQSSVVNCEYADTQGGNAVKKGRNRRAGSPNSYDNESPYSG
jgi:hypothetical protein